MRSAADGNLTGGEAWVPMRKTVKKGENLPKNVKSF